MLTLPTGEKPANTPPLSELLEANLPDPQAWVRSSLFLNTLAGLRASEERDPL